MIGATHRTFMESDKPSPAAPPPVPAGGLPFPIVGIGASAGGYAALMALLQNMPPSPGMALVVILHLAADEPSAADKVLQRATGMPVVQVGHTMPILPDHVYVIPPDRSLAMRDGHLALDELERSPGRPVAVDKFLRTLATAHKERAIGVVLSGMGSDGTAGLACIKEMGGATIAQLPSDAEYGGMPRSVIDSGMADFVLAASAIPDKLAELRDIASEIRRRALHGRLLDGVPLDVGPAPGIVLRNVLALLRERTGHDFTHYRRPTLLRRLERRLQVRGMADLDGYHALLQRDSSEARALLKDLLIGVTSFYRDPEAFDALDRLVLPALFQPGRVGPRVWSAACSTGEEAWTLAMLLAGQAARSGEGQDWQVFGSDLDDHAIEVARSGAYPASIAEAVPAYLLQRHFTLEGDQYKVRRALRDQVLFTPHNLLHEPAFSRLDLISCRNLLIYLNLEMHRHLLQQFHFALNPGGYLLLGSAESVDGAGDLFEPVDAARRIYRARPAAVRAPVPPFARAAGIAPLRGLPSAGVPAGSYPAADPGAYAVARTAANPAPGAATGAAAQAPTGAAPLAAAGAAPVPRRGRLFSFAEIHLHKAAELAPPSILLNAEADIVHVSEQAARFLRPGAGEPTRELVALVLPPLQLALRAALFQVRRSGQRAATGPVRYEGEGGTHAVDMQVQPFRDPHAEGELLLVEFCEPPADCAAAGAASAAGAAGPHAPLGDGALLRQLDEELRHARKQLQETIEQTEVANGEMRIQAEEMQTTMEELHSGAEALERGRAELLSANQELAADNRELRRRAQESAKAHDDLANLVASSGVATIFLDRDMRILRYTPRIADFFNVLPADVGRPLLHITNRLDYPRLAEDAATVFGTLQALEREVRSKDGRDYIVRVHPYRTTTDRIEGAVMSFFDITGRRAAEEALRKSEEHFRLFLTASSDIVYRMSADWRQMHSLQGKGFLTDTDDTTSAWLDTYIPVPDRPQVQAAIDAAIAGKTIFELEHRVIRSDGSFGWTFSRAIPLLDAAGNIVEWFGAADDISRRKHEEEVRRASEARLSTVFESLPVGVCVMGANGTMLLSNRIMHRYLPTGVMPSLDPERGSRWRAWHGDGRPVAFHEFPGARALRGERVVPGIEMLFHQDDGRELWTQVASAPVSDDSGRNTGEVMVVVTDIDALKRAEAGLRVGPAAGVRPYQAFPLHNRVNPTGGDDG